MIGLCHLCLTPYQRLGFGGVLPPQPRMGKTHDPDEGGEGDGLDEEQLLAPPTATGEVL
jgi:hypothetical protein